MSASRPSPSVKPLPPEVGWRRLRSRALQLALLLVAVAALATALPGLGDLRTDFDSANPAFVGLSGACELCSCLGFVVAFRAVFCRRLSWRFSYNLALAEQATNVLLPTGGAGGLAVGAWFLRRAGMPTEYIGRRSVAFFLFTSIPNFGCTIIIGGMLAIGLLPGNAPALPTIAFASLALAAVGLTAFLPRLLDKVSPPHNSNRFGAALRDSATTLAAGVRDTAHLVKPFQPLAWAGSVGYFGFDVLALAAAFSAFGATPQAGPLLFAYVIGQLGGLIPLPGGIGGTEGGLVGALVLYGAPFTQAVAAVLTYRAYQLGIPSLLGVLAFTRVRRTLASAAQPAALCAPLAEPLQPA